MSKGRSYSLISLSLHPVSPESFASFPSLINTSFQSSLIGSPNLVRPKGFVSLSLSTEPSERYGSLKSSFGSFFFAKGSLTFPPKAYPLILDCLAFCSSNHLLSASSPLLRGLGPLSVCLFCSFSNHLSCATSLGSRLYVPPSLCSLSLMSKGRSYSLISLSLHPVSPESFASFPSLINTSFQSSLIGSPNLVRPKGFVSLSLSTEPSERYGSLKSSFGSFFFAKGSLTFPPKEYPRTLNSSGIGCLLFRKGL